MLFLVWYDGDSRRSVDEKVQDALGAYHRRFKTTPNLVLVNAVDVVDVAGVEVRSARTVQPHHFWVGMTEASVPLAAGEEG
jgi:hypothetical protein